MTTSCRINVFAYVVGVWCHRYLVYRSIDFHRNDEICIVHRLLEWQETWFKQTRYRYFHIKKTEEELFLLQAWLNNNIKSQESELQGTETLQACFKTTFYHIKYDWCYCRTDAGRDKQSAVCVYMEERLCLFGFEKQLVWVWHSPAMTEMSLSEPTTTRWGKMSTLQSVFLTIKHNYLVKSLLPHCSKLLAPMFFFTILTLKELWTNVSSRSITTQIFPESFDLTGGSSGFTWI